MAGPLELSQAIDKSGRIPAEAEAWLVEGFKRYKQGIPLEEALGLTSAGRRAARDEAYRKAAALLVSDGKISTWDAAGQIARKVKTLRCVVEIRGDDALTHIIKESLASGARPVTTARGIYNIIC
ncbi:MAG: hypothetical protein CMK32_03855 [Porticoccaceae bacterium]|nr:hypothetical protein [Porticoccaceae bacterium]